MVISCIERRKALLHEITELQAELAVPDGPFEDGLWRLGYHDSVNGMQIQVALLNQLLAHPEQQTPDALLVQLRSLFAQYDQIHAALAALPNFDHIGDDEELAVEDLSEEDRELYDQSMSLYQELFVNQHQHALIAELLDIEECRVHDLVAVIGAHYESAETRSICRHDQQALSYPLVKDWIERGGILFDQLPEFHAWMREGVQHG